MEPPDLPVDTLIILASDQATFYDFLKPRQEARGRTLVLLERRRGDRRRAREGIAPERRRRQRRAPVPEAALAMMSVLGFMILHRQGDRWAD
jgi:hypothetical protein